MPLQKPSSILFFSILLIIVAVGLLGTSVYFVLESRNQVTAAPIRKTVQTAAVPPVANPVIHAVQTERVDTAATSSISADSITKRLDEIYEMKKALTAEDTRKPDMQETEASRQKINELLQKVEELKSRTTKVESENKFLKDVLQQLTDELRSRQNRLTRNAPAPAHTGSMPVKETSKLTLSDMRLSFLNNAEKETNNSGDATTLSGSFILHASGSGDQTLYIIVTRPDGSTLQTSAWDGGIFETTEGRKMYSYKMVASSADAAHRASFSIPTENILKGTYIIQVYNNGVIIARTTRTLN